MSTVNVKGILGVSDEESRALIDQVSALIAAPEYVYQHRWQVGDLIFWDNFLLQHARTPFNSAEKRTLRRCQIAYL